MRNDKSAEIGFGGVGGIGVGIGSIEPPVELDDDDAIELVDDEEDEYESDVDEDDNTCGKAVEDEDEAIEGVAADEEMVPAVDEDEDTIGGKGVEVEDTTVDPPPPVELDENNVGVTVEDDEMMIGVDAVEEDEDDDGVRCDPPVLLLETFNTLPVLLLLFTITGELVLLTCVGDEAVEDESNIGIAVDEVMIGVDAVDDEKIVGVLAVDEETIGITLVDEGMTDPVDDEDDDDDTP